MAWVYVLLSVVQNRTQTCRHTPRTLWIIGALSLVSTLVEVDGFRPGRPGLNSPAKLWWTKGLTSDLYISGRPSTRWIKYAYEGGFRSILSVFSYNKSSSFGSDYVPTTDEAWNLARSLGMGYVSLIPYKSDWKRLEVIQKLSEAVQGLPKPALLHCNTGYSVTFLTLMYMANQTRNDPGFEPKVDSRTVYTTAVGLGFDFTEKPASVELISLVTGEPVVADPPALTTEPVKWRSYWPAYPVQRNWFISGQVRKGDIGALEKTGFKSVINLRLGSVHRGRPSQEQVTLLNVNDNQWTYGRLLCAFRQSTSILERSRINPGIGSEYVSKNASINYETVNTDEFGDEVGYNERLEKQFFESHPNITYYHLPIDEFGIYRPGLFRKIRSTLMEAGKKGPVLLHCSSGKRSAYIGVLAAAVQEGHGLGWALNRLRQIGYIASRDIRPDVYTTYKYTLRRPKRK